MTDFVFSTIIFYVSWIVICVIIRPLLRAYNMAEFAAFWSKGKGKGKRREHTSKAFRYGMRSQGISQFYLHTSRSSINGMIDWLSKA